MPPKSAAKVSAPSNSARPPHFAAPPSPAPCDAQDPPRTASPSKSGTPKIGARPKSGRPKSAKDGSKPGTPTTAAAAATQEELQKKLEQLEAEKRMEEQLRSFLQLERVGGGGELYLLQPAAAAPA